MRVKKILVILMCLVAIYIMALVIYKPDFPIFLIVSDIGHLFLMMGLLVLWFWQDIISYEKNDTKK